MNNENPNPKQCEPELFSIEACLNLTQEYDPKTNYALVLVSVLRHLTARAMSQKP